jgi:uncharacterized membrane protein
VDLVPRTDWEPVLAWIAKNTGKVAGAAIGLVVGLIFIWLGFWRGLFLTVMVWVGYYVGSRRDEHESLGDLINRLLPPGE